MAKRGFGPRLSLLWLAMMCATTAAGAVLAVVYQESEYAVISIVMVVVVMFVGRIFGIAELQLVSKRMADAGMTFLSTGSKNAKQVQQSLVQLQGNRDWQLAWDHLCEFADVHEINDLTFDLNLPWIHESLHATRKQPGQNRGESQEWHAEVPVIADGRIFGRIKVTAWKDSRFSCQDVITNLLKLTVELEDLLFDVANDNSLEPVSSEEADGHPAVNDRPVVGEAGISP